MIDKWHFDFFYSIPFWLALIFAAFLVRLARSNVRLKGYILLASSNVMLLAIPGFHVRDLLMVWSICAVSFAFSWVLCRQGGGGDENARRWIASLGVTAILVCLSFFKYHFFQDLVLQRHARPPKPSDYVFLIGVSYFSFKAIHVIVESYNHTITRLDALSYFNYITFFPSFISGPINRYDDFAAQAVAPGHGSLKRDLKIGGEKIVHGLFKKLVLVSLIFPYILTNQPTPLDKLSGYDFVIGLYAYALYFYFDFSGYSDLAIGGAHVIGIQLPENFNKPFLQRNIRDLWSNWHMSLTGWLVDYVYWPVVRKLRNFDYFRSRPVLLSVVGMNVTFIACGMWHGNSLNFVLWGAYHGLGISTAIVYQRQKKRLRSRSLQAYFASRYSRMAGALLTFNFFAAGLALFVLDTGKLRILLSAVFHWGHP